MLLEIKFYPILTCKIGNLSKFFFEENKISELWHFYGVKFLPYYLLLEYFAFP